MPKYPLFRVLLHLLVGLWTAAFVFPLVGAAGREARVRRWSAQLLAICGVRVKVRMAAGVPPAARALIVANHISWLDIFVINSLQPCRFVAKSDIRDWPLVGWLCEKSGTIFIARGRQRDVRRIFKGLVESIHAGERVAFFPEGTTAAQGTVLPFHSNLFEAAIDARVPIQPYALRYLGSDGEPHEAINFDGDMTFAESMLRVLRVRRFTAELILLSPIGTEGAHRRELAAATREAIVAALRRDPAVDTADTPPAGRPGLPA
ncbi:MAG: plsC [Herminiimonas sp.]|nr:plsC [Herminiimonas sp.]